MIRSSIFVLALLALVALGAACSSVPLTSPTGSTITMTSDRSVLPLNGQATLRAVVIEESGTPVQNGTVVTFSPTLGTVDPVEAKTVNGVATVMFNAGAVSGKSSIVAFSGGAKTETPTEITIGSAAAKTIALNATPSSVSQSGGTVTVAALVLDESGNPLPGVNVNFSATTGQLSATSALTDATGTARAQLTTTQTSEVTATAGSATPGKVTVAVTAAPTVEIDPITPAPIAGVPVAITVKASSGSPTAPRQVQTLTVDFGDGSSETRTNVTGSAAFTHTYGAARGYTITATAVDVAGNSGTASRGIVVTRSLPTPTLTVSPNPADKNQIVGFNVTTTTTAGGPQVESIRVLINGEVVFTTTGSSGAFTKGFSEPGTYTVTAEATDSAGGVGRTNTFLTVKP